VDIINLKADTDNVRLDTYISDKLDGFSRNYVQKLIKTGDILINNKTEKPGYKIKTGDEIRINRPEPETLKAEPENIPLDIVYEDRDIIIVNKGKGMVVHPSKGHPKGTLINALLYHYKDSLSDINGVLRPGIVHRIDMDTTGLLVIARNNNAHKELALKLKNHEIERVYYAVVDGIIEEDEGMIDAPIGRHKKDRKKMGVDAVNGKDARTHFKVLERFENKTYLEINLETGRTHQIRVHLSHIGYPVMGDETYGRKSKEFVTQGQVLHAGKLKLLHPATKKPIEFFAPFPEYFENILKSLK
jgi:23S rRNA pseudouridine1911/1915/1917 synthase